MSFGTDVIIILVGKTFFGKFRRFPFGDLSLGRDNDLDTLFIYFL